jgi:NAD(P)-dependent dehydrogenase (short-subunit alcohol dehydrogenase family)
LTALAAELDPSGTEVMAHQLDVADLASCAAFLAAVADRFGPVHGVVDVAALDAVFGGIAGADWDQWHQAVEVNLFGAAHLVSAALDHLAPDGSSIVFVGSQTNFFPPHAVLQAAYAASKHAVIGMMRHLAVELGPRHVRLNVVAPGWMWGPAVEGYVRSTADTSGQPFEEVRASITRNLPLQDMATDGDVAETINFLLSERARGITGQTVMVNAGEFML